MGIVIEPPVEFAGFDDDSPRCDELGRGRTFVLAYLYDSHVDGFDRDIETSCQLQDQRNQFKGCRIVELVVPVNSPCTALQERFFASKNP